VRPALAAVWRRPGGRFGLSALALLVLVAALGDFLASDKPLALALGGELYLFPNLHDVPALRAHTTQSLVASMGAEDWLVPVLVPWGPNQQDIGQPPLAAPSGRHWLGTDTARRDVLARLIHGARVSILVGVIAVALYVALGTLLGLVAGYYRGWVDAVVSRLTEVLLSIPVFFLILAVMGLVEQAGVLALVVVIALVYWTRIARLVRAETLRLRELEYVQAARALGFSDLRVMLRHVLPNAAGPIWVAATFGVAGTILIEASLSFLGFGAPDTVASWGGLLRGAMGNFHAWWLVLFPGAAIFVTITATNLAGEALRDALDPRLRGRDVAPLTRSPWL